MKTNFKKLALTAGISAAMAAGSMSANAVILGVPGEAQLVPFVLASDTGPADDSFGTINTVVKLTIPAAIGYDTAINLLDPHTAPTNPGAKELPDVDLRGAHIHWYFLNERSEHVLNGIFPVTPDDVVVVDWSEVVKSNRALNGKAGYLVFVTNKGADGENANFSFFADAYLTNFVNDYFASVNIPALALADGADGGVGKPTLDNNVIVPFTKQVVVSPLVSGTRTNYSDGKADFTLIDLALTTKWAYNFPGGEFTQDSADLLVVWNDRNETKWSSVGVDVFDTSEVSCSWTVSLPKELNLVYVPHTDPGTDIDPYAVPKFITDKGLLSDSGTPQGTVNPLCQVGNVGPDAGYLGNRLNSGFVKLYLPEPVDSNIGTAESSAVAFTISLPGGKLEEVPYYRQWFGETILGHDRGKMNQ